LTVEEKKFYVGRSCDRLEKEKVKSVEVESKGQKEKLWRKAKLSEKKKLSVG